MEQALAKIRRAGLKPADLALVERRAGVMRERIQLRATRVDEQLRGIRTGAYEIRRGRLCLSGLLAGRSRSLGDAMLDRVKLQGKNTLHIQARRQGERTRASWRSQLCMLPGWYRFEGMACANLLSGGSARLRISGDTRSVGISGSSGWQSLSHDFQVQEGSRDVELVCELNALQGGDVWFDLDSLRVKRIAGPAMRAIIRQPVLQE